MQIEYDDFKETRKDEAETSSSWAGVITFLLLIAIVVMAVGLMFSGAEQKEWKEPEPEENRCEAGIIREFHIYDDPKVIDEFEGTPEHLIHWVNWDVGGNAPPSEETAEKAGVEIVEAMAVGETPEEEAARIARAADRLVRKRARLRQAALDREWEETRRRLNLSKPETVPSRFAKEPVVEDPRECQ